jgi:hypothetical protein
VASTHVKEAWVDVGGLLEDDHVPASPLRRGNLPARGQRV